MNTIYKKEKFCPSCLEIKSVDFYYRNKASKDGLESYCKICSYEKQVARNKKRSDYKKKEAERARIYRENNTEKVKETHKKFREKHKEKLSTKRKSAKNLERIRNWKKEKRKDPIFKMRHNVSRQVVHGLKRSLGSKHGQPVFDALNYTPEQLKEHLEKQFDDKMNWENYGSYWHIDHIIPHSSFNYSSMQDEQFKKCWALENLRPLEAIENIKKSNKILEEYNKC